KDLHRDLAVVLTQEVVDRHALEHVAAWAVDVHGHRAAAHAPERRRHTLCGDALTGPEVLADHVVHADRAIVLAGGRGAHAGIPSVQRPREDLGADAGAYATLRRTRQLLDRHGVQSLVVTGWSRAPARPNPGWSWPTAQ